VEESEIAADACIDRAGSNFASDNDMVTGDVFVLVLIAISIGWVAVAAVRSNRRHGTHAMQKSDEGQPDLVDAPPAGARVDRLSR
jgi:hypothetical protein